MPTHIAAAILLYFRGGIKIGRLIIYCTACNSNAYHNKVLHLFAQEALWACALYALDRNAEKNRNLKKGENAKGQNRFYSVSSLLEHVIFLDKLMSFEFVLYSTSFCSAPSCKCVLMYKN